MIKLLGIQKTHMFLYAVIDRDFIGQEGLSWFNTDGCKIHTLTSLQDVYNAAKDSTKRVDVMYKGMGMAVSSKHDFEEALHHTIYALCKYFPAEFGD